MSEFSTGNAVNDFFSAYHKAVTDINSVNIMIIGKTGVGKSTLINSIFREELAETGVGSPVTPHLRKYQKDDIPIAIYDSKGLELTKKVQKKIRKEIKDEIVKRARSGKETECIHALWYCINASGNRIEQFEIQWIEELAQILPVIVVLTMSLGEEADNLYQEIDKKNLPIKSIQKILSKPYKINDSITIPSHGLSNLVKVTYEILPEAVKKAFVNVQKVDIDFKANSAIKWAVNYIAATFGIGMSPIPFQDAFLLVPLQITMLAHITAIFGVSISQGLISGLIGAIGGAGGATMMGKYFVSNLLKLIPGIGTITGGLISGSVASLLTTGIAFAYVNVMKVVAKSQYAGESISDHDITEMFKAELAKELRKKRK